CVTATTGKVGVAYSSSITVTGGTAPYTFALNSGSLPAGLSLNPTTGLIRGITVAPPDMTAQCVTATTGKVGVPYSSSIGVTGGTAPYTFALNSGSLPNGLSLNPTTGLISGTPTSAGPFSFTVKVTDSTGGTAAIAITSNCGITIAPPDM